MRTLLITLACIVPAVASAGFSETIVIADSAETTAEKAPTVDAVPNADKVPTVDAVPNADPTPTEALPAGLDAPPTADTVVTESADADARTAEYVDEDPPFKRHYHGFRLGYTYVNNVGPDSKLDSPHLFVIGYEATQRIEGGDWLNVIVVENVSVAGLNQSLFIPSANGLVGFELAEQFQIGTGINFNPLDPSGKIIHQVIAAGWTPKAGKMNVPVHFTVIPDSDGDWRLGSTIGVNW